MSFDFIGSGLVLYGALRPNHGAFEAYVDQPQNPPSFQDDNAATDEYQQVIYTYSNPNALQDAHTLVSRAFYAESIADQRST